MKALIFLGEPETGKSRTAKLIERFIKGRTLFIGGRDVTKQGVLRDPFVFEGLTESTELVVIDDCPKHFEYRQFYSAITEDGFIVERRKRGELNKIITVENLIITAIEIDEELLNEHSFNKRFEVIKF